MQSELDAPLKRGFMETHSPKGFRSFYRWRLIQIRAEGGFYSYREADQVTNEVINSGYLFRLYNLIKSKI